jgi:hypothetical protein
MYIQELNILLWVNCQQVQILNMKNMGLKKQMKVGFSNA